MKKKILAVLMAIMVCMSSIGAVSVLAETGDLILSDTTTVNVDSETCYAKVTDSEYHTDSNNYIHFKAGAEDWLEVSQNLTEEVTAGSTYVLTVVAKPVSGRVWFRVGWDDTGWLVSNQTELATELEDGWFRYVKEITMTANQPNFLFHNDGEAEICVDSISLKPVDEEKELLLDGGFDAVAYDAEADVITLEKTTVNVANTENCFVDVLRTELPADNEYSLHLYTEGDWLEVSQPYTVDELAAGTYTLTWYAKGEGRIWFYSNWGAEDNPDEWVASHAVDSAVVQADGWTRYSKNINIDGVGDTKILFHSDGAVDLYIDDISLVDASGIDYIPDGGFGEVTVEGGEEPPVVDPDEPSTEDIPDENLILSNKTHINMENTDTCFAKVTDDEKSNGSYSLHFKAGASDWLEVDQTLTEGATAGSKYILSASVKVVSGKVWFRVGWDDTGWLVSNQTDLGTDLGNGWIKLMKEVTLTGDQTKLLFHNDGEAEMYIDDILLVAEGETENLVPDGGFEDVTVNIPTEDIPDEMLVLSNKTSVNQENTDTCFAKVTDNEKSNGNYSLHFKTGGEDWLEVSQRLIENAVTGDTYILSATVKVVSGKVWFRLGWDDDAWLVSSQAELGTDVGNGWIKLVKEVTVKGNDGDLNTILFHNDGATEMYIDDLSLVKVGETTELVPDGGFEDVIVACDEHAWDEGVVTTEPTVDAEGIKTFTCTSCGAQYTEAIEKLPAPSHTPGDPNGDDKVDIKDAIAIRRFIAGGYGVTINEAAANVNGDAKIDIKDVIAIRRFIAGGYGIELK